MLTKIKKYALVTGVIIFFMQAYTSENKGIFAWLSQWWDKPKKESAYQKNEKTTEEVESLKKAANDYLEKAVAKAFLTLSLDKQAQKQGFAAFIGKTIDKLNDNPAPLSTVNLLKMSYGDNIILENLNLAQLVCIAALLENNNLRNDLIHEFEKTHKNPLVDDLTTAHNLKWIAPYALTALLLARDAMSEISSYRKGDVSQSMVLKHDLPGTLTVLGVAATFNYTMARLGLTAIYRLVGVPKPDDASKLYLNHLDSIHKKVLSKIEKKQQSVESFAHEISRAEAEILVEHSNLEYTSSVLQPISNLNS